MVLVNSKDIGELGRVPFAVLRLPFDKLRASAQQPQKGRAALGCASLRSFSLTADKSVGKEKDQARRIPHATTILNFMDFSSSVSESQVIKQKL